ncbi:MAG: PEP-CTERM sorting domain-containing protein [Verrucomicrobiales bacterium]|nr:PEP-CTERM sorting domain-containing protein [Verrucomicrobiales bacterium]
MKTFKLTLLFLAAATIHAHSALLDWQTIGWNLADTTGQQVFTNVGGSGISATVSYTSNMWDGTPGFYGPNLDGWNGDADSTGNLRFTNNISGDSKPSRLTIEFNQSVYIDKMTLGGMSLVVGPQDPLLGQEQLTLTASSGGSLVPASYYAINDPLLALKDTNVTDLAYSTRGMDYQSQLKFGQAYFQFDSPVDRLTIDFSVLKPYTDTVQDRKASNWVSDIEFQAVPEPSTTLLLITTGLLISLRRQKCKHQI